MPVTISRARRAGEDGFTLIEILVVCLIVGLLAAIALPTFIGQQDKAWDTASKSDARDLVSHVEGCYAETADYRRCDSTAADELGSGMGVRWGAGPASVAVDSGATTHTYAVTAHSRSGNSFTIARTSDGDLERTCSDAGSATAGCRGGAW
jgi:type IV pilus assembly protein PilA